MTAEDIITDADRYPTLKDAGRRMLDFLREHPHAPIYRNQSGNRLTSEDVARVRAFDREVEIAEVGWKQGELPAWLPEFIEKSFSEVPFYRGYGSPPKKFEDIPTISRGDLSHDITRFFPDDVPVDRLINFRTSGTTGHPLLIASHPVVSASYLSFHKRALRRFDLKLSHGRGRVGAVLTGYQKQCFTYVSVTPLMDESGFAKINLHPSDWRNPNDRARYLDALAPEVYTGDPISFEVLASLPLQTRPLALISTSMTLLPGLRQRLQERFGCPVLDIYSMNEAGPIAVADAKAGGHVLLQPNLYIEILDGTGRPLPPGERGEITLTGGFNFCLPLLRYRTGDYAALRFNGTESVLEGLEGRPPVRYRTMTGEMINNIEITHALRRYAIPQFTLHQDLSGGLLMQLAGSAGESQAIRDDLMKLFGAGQLLKIERVKRFSDKVVQYTSDLT